MLDQFRLYQLISPALPVGAFTYSQGLEYAAQTGVVHDYDSYVNWLDGMLQQNILQLDLPLLIRCYAALQAGDADQFIIWNDFILASRETSELYSESVNMAKALKRLLEGLNYPTQLLADIKNVDWVSAFAFVSWHWQISLEASLQGYVWSWLENQVAAAIKLVPLGQTQGQTILHEFSKKLPVVIEQAHNVSDERIGNIAPMFAMMSALHETQYSRLFRS